MRGVGHRLLTPTLLLYWTTRNGFWIPFLETVPQQQSPAGKAVTAQQFPVDEVQHEWASALSTHLERQVHGQPAAASSVQLATALCHQRMVVAPCVFELMGKIPNRFSLFDRFFPFLLSHILSRAHQLNSIRQNQS